MITFDRVNEALEPIERHTLCRDGFREKGPVVAVIGVARSGTTLAVQVLAKHVDCAYVDHAMARFWRAPSVGRALSASLWSDEERRSAISLQSDYGRTADPRDVHHYGYFWRTVLGTDVNGREIAKPRWGLVQSLLNSDGRPWVVQGQHLMLRPAALERYARVIWVWICRDPAAVQNSWDRAPHTQFVGAQYGTYLLRRKLDTLFESRSSVIAFDYETLCADPGKLVSEVSAKLEKPPISVPDYTFEVR